MNILRRTMAITALMAVGAGSSRADELNVAVAANFIVPAKKLAIMLQDSLNVAISISSGSTGTLFAQIKNGAPFDVFLSADTTRPEQLEIEGRAVQGSRFTYAIGKLVLWSSRKGFFDNNEGGVLCRKGITHLALTNARTAPYGAAAEQVLGKLCPEYTFTIVKGTNVIQTMQFIQSGNADLGFVALSQIRSLGTVDTGSCWVVPSELYRPLKQQAVLLTTAKESAAAAAFMTFLHSARAKKCITDSGYDVPDE